MLTGKCVPPEKNPRYLNGRRRANSSAANSRAVSPRPSTAGHNRASSEFSPTYLREGADTNSLHGTRMQRQASAITALGYLPGSPGLPPAFNPLSADFKKAGHAPQITLSGSTPFPEVVSVSPFCIQQPTGTSSQSSLGDSERRSFYESDDDDSTGFKDPDDIPILEREDDLDGLDEDDKPVQNRGVTWDELITRLISLPMSRSDETFVVIFLCFYRKFSAPRDLLTAITDRYRAIGGEEKIRIKRLEKRHRYCNVLHKWVTTHPGDFSNPKTQKQLLAFLDSISSDRSFSVMANEVAKAVEGEVEDEDEGWGKVDEDGPDNGRSSLNSFLSASSTPFADKAWQLQLDSATTLQVPGAASVSESRTDAGDSSSMMGASIGLVSSRTDSGMHPLNPSAPKVGSQFDLFMAIPVGDIAGELTRMDWNEFSRVRPRDLVRHISVPQECRENGPNLACINNLINHFNYIAYWVASVILEKPKPKHRAKALEKFMEVAWVGFCLLSGLLRVGADGVAGTETSE